MLVKCRNRFEPVKGISERAEHGIIKLSFWVVEGSLRGQKAPLRSDWGSLRGQKPPRWTDWRSLRVEHEEKVWRGGRKHAIGVCELEHGI